jgi:capsular polysaccharide transport system permease protein
MNEYRIKEGVIDPTSSVVSSNVLLMQSLQASLAQLQTQLNSLSRQQLDPNSPALQVLRSRIQATKDELLRVEKEVGQKREGTRPLTEVMAKFEQLNLDLQYAQNFVVSSRQMLDQARANAAAQHLYLTPYVTPAVAESATYPKRGTMILMYGLAFFGLWLIGLLIVRSIREHAA